MAGHAMHLRMKLEATMTTHVQDKLSDLIQRSTAGWLMISRANKLGIHLRSLLHHCCSRKGCCVRMLNLPFVLCRPHYV